MEAYVLTPDNHSPSVVEQLRKLPKKLSDQLIAAHIKSVPCHDLTLTTLHSALNVGLDWNKCNIPNKALALLSESVDEFGGVTLQFWNLYPEYYSEELSDADVNDLAIAAGLLDPPSEPSGAEMEVTDTLKHKAEDVTVDRVKISKKLVELVWETYCQLASKNHPLSNSILVDNFDGTYRMHTYDEFLKLDIIQVLSHLDRLSAQYIMLDEINTNIASVKIDVDKARILLQMTLNKISDNQGDELKKLNDIKDIVSQSHQKMLDTSVWQNNSFVKIGARFNEAEQNAADRHTSLHDRLNNLSASWQLVGGLLALDILVRVICYFL